MGDDGRNWLRYGIGWKVSGELKNVSLYLSCEVVKHQAGQFSATGLGATGSQACGAALSASCCVLPSSSFFSTSDSSAPAPLNPATAAIPFVSSEASGSSLSVASTAATAPTISPTVSRIPMTITVYVKCEQLLLRRYQRVLQLRLLRHFPAAAP